jgi:hypothetical protein
VLPKGGTHVYLTDTLENPHNEPLQLGLFYKPIAEQHAKALKVKSSVPVIVCLGNPPYDRHEAAGASNKAQTGNWVRWGDKGDGGDSILMDFIRPAAAAGHGVHIKNLYNLYVYFWRWALRKVLEHQTASGPGVVSLISASSYIDGDAFAGTREHMRRVCDEIWILDLGGEGRGTRRTENVFAIQTPVAIALALRTKKLREDRPAKVHYARIEGTREEKLEALDAISGLNGLRWQECPSEWQAPFRPSGKGKYFSWPLLTDLMPWQHSGAQFKRTWPIAPDKELLRRRWRDLLQSSNRAPAFKETRDRKVESECVELPKSGANQADHKRLPSIKQLSSNAPVPRIERYAYRSFDRQWVVADTRVGDFIRPEFWRAHGENQIYVSTLLNHPLGKGPAITCCAYVPDLHHFRGSYGAKEILPLYRDCEATEANVLPGVLELLGREYKCDTSPEDFLAYLYGVLAQPAFTSRYSKELETRELRVPITKDAALFKRVREIGARLLWLHTYGERFVSNGRSNGYIPHGAARCTKQVPGDPKHYPERYEFNESTRILRVGGGEFAPVERAVFEFEVSGLKVVQSWLKYRMKDGAGRQSSPLDKIRPERWTSQFTTELLELLWVLEKTLAAYPEQEELLRAVIASEGFKAGELPAVPEAMRRAPSPRTGDSGLFESA